MAKAKGATAELDKEWKAFLKEIARLRKKHSSALERELVKLRIYKDEKGG